ncbi:MAG TPA: hypothetical protein VF656_11235 [Pyrinomonadaceae bacterium]|jgi:O-methyltransferase involved in polyketide biosynthesis
MNLPASFDDVPYYRKRYSGDLIVTEGVLYYFTHTDVEQNFIDEQRKRFAPSISLSNIPRNFPLILKIAIKVTSTIIWSVAYATRIRGTNHSYLRGGELWAATDSNAELQSKLDAHISQLKLQKTSSMDFSSSLPKPQRFTLAEIKNLKLTEMGRLTFDTEFDNHDFKVGIIRRGLLIKALLNGGFSLSE